MNKELEALGRAILEFEKELEDDYNSEWSIEESFLEGVIAGMKKCYQRLEAIDNANPSEALKGLKHIKKYYVPEPCTATTYDYLEIIEQALLKAQETEKVFEIIKVKPIESGIAIEQIKKQRDLTYSQYKKAIVELSEAYLLTEEEFNLLKKHFLKEVK